MTRPIQIDPHSGVATKSVDAATLMAEVRMTECAYDLAHRGKLFRVPRLVSYDVAQQSITLEYISDTVPLHYLLRSDPVPVHLFARAGQVVAQLHCHLKLDQQYLAPLPPSIDGPGPKSFLHSDLNLINVRYRAQTDELVLLDWSSSPLIGAAANWGTVYWDLAHFVRSTIVSPPIRLAGKEARWKLADAFLQSYVDHAGLGPLDEAFFLYCRGIHVFFKRNERAHLQWYRYLRYAMLNLSSFRKYVNRKLDTGVSIS
jgi:hypothetical protein